MVPHKTIEEIAIEDGRYDVKALKYVFEGLASVIDKIREHEPDSAPRHITGQELTWGLAELASRRWGRLAVMVLNEWGLYSTRDFGEIVYLMIESGWMSSQETDAIEDFDQVFDFRDHFELQYSIDI